MKSLIVMIVCGFCFWNPGIVQAEAKKAQVDKQSIEALNASIKNIDHMELVLKKFFKTSGDSQRIDGDLSLLTKHAERLGWRFEARGDEILFKSKKKTLFKFRPLTEGERVNEFTFNFNGQKFAINPNRSYFYHKKQLEGILGSSKQGLLEDLLIKEARAFIFVALVAVMAVGAFIWHKKSRAKTTPKKKKPQKEKTSVKGDGVKSGGEKPADPRPVAETPGRAVAASEKKCSDGKERQEHYNSCRENEHQWRVFDPGLDDKNCTKETINYCALNLNYTHFKGFAEGATDEEAKESCLKRKKSYHTKDKMCEKPGYVLLDTHNKLKFLGNRLSFLIEKSGGDSPMTFESGFKSGQCEDFAKKDVTNLSKPDEGWGMKPKWAKKYCKVAGEIHKACLEAAKKCSSDIGERKDDERPEAAVGGTEASL